MFFTIKTLYIKQFLLLFGGGALILLSLLGIPAQAKNTSPIHHTNPGHADLSDRLVANKHFQELSFLVYSLTGKLQKSKSTGIFQKYFLKTITDVETAQLLRSLELSSKEELNNLLRSIFLAKTRLQIDFPELTHSSDAGIAVKLACAKISKGEKFANPAEFNPSCWDTFLLSLSACNLGCLSEPDYWACYDPCFAMASAFWGICQLIEP